jgi:hypothetical protein
LSFRELSPFMNPYAVNVNGGEHKMSRGRI